MKHSTDVTHKLYWKPIEGELYNNRARYHIRRLMHEKGFTFKHGLKDMSARGLYNFVCYGSHIKLHTLQKVADALGVKLETLLRPHPDE